MIGLKVVRQEPYNNVTIEASELIYHHNNIIIPK